MDSSSQPRGLRVAHLPDIHLRPDRGALELTIATIRHAIDGGAKGILLGGDTVMASVGVDEQTVLGYWELWHRVKSEFSEIPFFPCLGNQDVWGWHQKASRCTGSEPLFGKKMFLKQVGIPRSYYATRLGTWRLIVLDSIQRGGNHGFISELDSEQRAWLTHELEADEETPTVILSHVPLVPGPAEFFAADRFKPDSQGRWSLEDHLVHIDSHEITNELAKHLNVKVCLAGHTHVSQTIRYRNISYIVSPPVSGAWWRGEFLSEPRGYGMLELCRCGEFAYEAVSGF